jgi:hypothetical protein
LKTASPTTKKATGESVGITSLSVAQLLKVLPHDKQAIFDNTHPAILEQEVFDKVQKI